MQDHQSHDSQREQRGILMGAIVRCFRRFLLIRLFQVSR